MQSSLRTDAEARWFRESRNEIGEEFRMSLDAQSEIQQIGGRAAVLDFSKVTTLGHVPNTEHAYSPKHLLDILSDREASHRGGIRRRLIILEDLGRNWIQVLGSRLGMPLSVFERHWARPEHHSLGKVRIPLGQDNRYHFVLSYVQSHPIVITGRNKGVSLASIAADFSLVSGLINTLGSTYRIACNAYRTIAFNVKEDNLKHQASDQLVTYWATDSNNDGEGGWTGNVESVKAA